MEKAMRRLADRWKKLEKIGRQTAYGAILQ
jgi:hypothetical protein